MGSRSDVRQVVRDSLGHGRTSLPIEFNRRAAAKRCRGEGAVRPRILDGALAPWLQFGRDPSPEAARYGKRAISTVAPTTFGPGYYLSLRDHDRREALATLSDLPVEILGESLDRLLPPEHSSARSALLPDADVTIAESAGTCCPWKGPKLVSEGTLRVIDRVPQFRTLCA